MGLHQPADKRFPPLKPAGRRDDADHQFPGRPAFPQKQVPQHPFPGQFVIGRDFQLPGNPDKVPDHRRKSGVLQRAVLRRDQPVGTPRVKPRPKLAPQLGQRVLGFVAVVVGRQPVLPAAEDRLHPDAAGEQFFPLPADGKPANAGKGVGHRLLLQPQLLPVVDMPEGTAAALLIDRAAGFNPGGRGGQDLVDDPEAVVFLQLDRLQPDPVPRGGQRDKHGKPVHPADPVAIQRHPGDFRFIQAVFGQCRSTAGLFFRHLFLLQIDVSTKILPYLPAPVKGNSGKVAEMGFCRA